MLDYQNHFDDAEHLARFMGVSPATVYRWADDALPTRSASRLLAVLAELAASSPALLAHLVAPYRKAKPPRYVTSRYRDTPPPTGTLAGYYRGDYDDLIAAMTSDEEFNAWYARLQ